jgi:predicted MPP superfamily phosphohydrolase
MEKKSLTRRQFLGRCLIGGAAVAAIGSADALFLEPRNLVAERVDIRLARLPEAFHGFRIAQISDVHFGPYMGKPGLERALQLAQSFRPDLVVVTGDFVSHPFGRPNGPQGAHYAEPCADVLTTVTPTQVLAILGNHDHWNDAGIVEGALQDRGIQVLRNRSVPIERGGSRIWISGVDDALVSAADLDKALRGVPPSETTVLLAHEPDFADYASHFPVDLQLSGHSHGGQVRLPGIGALVLPEMAEKYPLGLNRVGALQVYTNRGLGVINPPVRFNCPPEVTFVTLFSASRV